MTRAMYLRPIIAEAAEQSASRSEAGSERAGAKMNWLVSLESAEELG